MTLTLLDRKPSARQHKRSPTVVPDEVRERYCRTHAGSLVFEEMGADLRVTARDEHGRVLWGFTACAASLDEIHTLVATYGQFNELLRDALIERGASRERPPADAHAAAYGAIEALERRLRALRYHAKPTQKGATAASKANARRIARIAEHAARQIDIELQQFQLDPSASYSSAGAGAEAPSATGDAVTPTGNGNDCRKGSRRSAAPQPGEGPGPVKA